MDIAKRFLTWQGAIGALNGKDHPGGIGPAAIDAAVAEHFLGMLPRKYFVDRIVAEDGVTPSRAVIMLNRYCLIMGYKKLKS
jgi:hypothetical protein